MAGLEEDLRTRLAETQEETEEYAALLSDLAELYLSKVDRGYAYVAVLTTGTGN
jgi:hypothetical protein